MTDECGAGTAMGVALAGAVVVVFALLAPLAVVLEASHRAAAAADQAALAAGDTALGLIPGVPCERAAQLAVAGGARLERCRQQGDRVRVRVHSDVLGLPIAAEAVAGPAGAVR